MDANNETANQNGLVDGYGTWKNEMVDYTYKKSNFQGVADPYKKVTTEFIKSQEVLYNPITQTFANNTQEQQVRQNEQQNMTNTLAANKVSHSTSSHQKLTQFTLAG